MYSSETLEEPGGPGFPAATKIAGKVANAKMKGAGSGPTAAQKARAKGSAAKMEDLSGDGKVTKKDVLIGRGVIEKVGSPDKDQDKRNRIYGQEIHAAFDKLSEI